MKRFTLLILAALVVCVTGLTACGTASEQMSTLAHSEKVTLVTDALSIAVLPAVEVFLDRHPEHADLVAQVALEAAESWPDGKTVSISLVGERIEEILDDKTDLSDTSRTAIMGILSSIRTGVRVVLKLRGYSVPETLTTDGAALMQQIAAIALEKGSDLPAPDH